MAITFNADGSTSGAASVGDLYSTFTSKKPVTTSLSPYDIRDSLKINIHDPAGDASRPNVGIQGPWANPHETNFGGQTFNEGSGSYYKYNQMLMTFAQNFDVFTQRKEIESPHWWFSRIPRGAFKLFNGVVNETRIYRGGLSTYAGLSQWEDIDPYPDGNHDPCAPLKYDTYNYGWETLAWKGKKAGWGSDPICLDTLKFVNQAIEQLGWILDTGVKYGIDMQEVWNRDMFIYQTVMAGHSYLMTSEFDGVGSPLAPRFVYQPFCKFGNSGADGTANKTYVDKPFIVFDASVPLEPINFDVLDQVREYLKTMCPEAAVGRIGTEPMFALAVSHDDVERYIRANEEERRYWIEANPQALIQHYGFAPTTFRRWAITNDGNQLRFKLKKYIANYTASGGTDTDDGEHPISYGNVGKKEFEGKAVWIAEYVPPRIAGRTGVNGAGIPTANPEYYMAEIAIAPVFMNKIFTNLFVPSVNTLGSGTYFGPVTGLNGKWAWRNIVSWDKNPEGKIGNFYGTFEIVPKPDTCVFEACSFLYRRCTKAMPSICPEANTKINPGYTRKGALVGSMVVGSNTSTTGTKTVTTVTLKTKEPIAAQVGDTATIKAGALSNASTPTAAAASGVVIGAPTPKTVVVQLATASAIVLAAAADASTPTNLTTVDDGELVIS